VIATTRTTRGAQIEQAVRIVRKPRSFARDALIEPSLPR